MTSTIAAVNPAAADYPLNPTAVTSLRAAVLGRAMEHIDSRICATPSNTATEVASIAMGMWQTAALALATPEPINLVIAESDGDSDGFTARIDRVEFDQATGAPTTLHVTELPIDTAAATKPNGRAGIVQRITGCTKQQALAVVRELDA
jgi:hypothetical protein